MWSPPNVKALSWSKSMMISFGIAVLVVSLPIILQQVPPYYSKLVWGTIMIIVGSAGSQLLPEWKRHKWLKWIRAVCIAIVIAVGALLTTHGWNERDNYFRNRTLMFAAVAEWKSNDYKLQEISDKRKYMESKSFNKFSELPLPTNRYISQAITVDRVNRTDGKTDRLVVLLMKYTYNIDKLALAINSYNTSRSSSFTKSIPIQHFKNIFIDKGTYTNASDSHNRLGNHIKTHYLKLLDYVEDIWIDAMD